MSQERSSLVSPISTVSELDVRAEQLRKEIQQLQVEKLKLEVQQRELQDAVRRGGEQQRYSDLYDLVPIGILDLDSKGFVIQTNRAAASLLGVPDRAALAGLSLIRFIETLYVREFNQHVSDCFGGRELQTLELELLQPSDEKVWVELISSPFEDEKNKTRICRTMMINVAERKKHELEIQRQEALLNDFFSHGACGFQWLSPRGEILRVNKALLDIVGYAATEYVGQSFAHFLTNRFVMNDLLYRLSRNETIQGYETELKVRDGSHRQVQITANMFREGQGPVHARCVIADITRRKIVESQLRQQDAQYRAIKSSAGIGTIVISENKITEMSPNLLEFLGYSADQQMPLKPEDFLPAMPSHSSNVTFRPVSIEITAKDGSQIPVLMTGSKTTTEPIQIVYLVILPSTFAEIESNTRQTDQFVDA